LKRAFVLEKPLAEARRNPTPVRGVRETAQTIETRDITDEYLKGARRSIRCQLLLWSITESPVAAVV
jgi:hypothetical protein